MKFLAKQYTFLLLFIAISSIAVAQPGWNWGDSVDVAKEKNALYTDMMNSGNYTAASTALEWLLVNTPDLNSSIYINGAKIYEGLAEKETDAAKKVQYEEKALSMYDLRIKYFGDEAAVLNRKVNAAYNFFKDDKTKYKELFEMLQKAVEVNGADIFDGNLLYYMVATYKYKKSTNALTDEQVFDIYSQIMDIVEQKKANGKTVKPQITDTIDKLLTSTVDVDCDFIEEKLGPKFRETQDVKLGKKIFGLMLAQKCTDTPLAVEVTEVIHASEPDFAIAKFIASRHQKDKNFDKAIEYYEEAIGLTEDNTKKAEVHLSIAKVQQFQGRKVAARESAREALKNDPSQADAYKLIGDLYADSFEDCKGGESRVKDYAVYIAAYNMYQKAGNREMMAQVKAAFPSIEDIFNENYKEGDSITVGCWIQETIKLERRPQ
ncbi:MAG: tetratricopeptide repeat protein [Bacteroidota bacterium]